MEITTAATTMIIENKAEEKYAGVKTSVWWDIENCEVPRGWDAHVIAKNVSSALLKMDYSGTVSISAYGDTNLIPRDVQQALSSTGVRLNHVPAGVKDASDKKILVDMCLWAADNPAPANFMLISGDRDFSYALHQLRMRTYNILLAQPSHASAALVAAAKSVWLWTSLASGGLPLSSVEPSRLLHNGRSHVSNFDMVKHPVSEHALFSKPTDSTPDVVDRKDLIIRESQVPERLPQETRDNLPQSDIGATGEFVNAQTLQNMPQSGRGATCQFSFDSYLKGKKHGCHRCGSMNHKVRDCPKEDLRAKVQGTDVGAKLCYNCGEPGHFKTKCPKLVRSSGKRTSEGYAPPAKRPTIMPHVYSMVEESTDSNAGSETREGSHEV